MSELQLKSTMAAAVVSVEVEQGQQVAEGQALVVLEAMKMHITVNAEQAGVVASIVVSPGQNVKAGDTLINLQQQAGEVRAQQSTSSASQQSNKALQDFQARQAHTLDDARTEALAKRHQQGYRSARENLNDLCDEGSFHEYGQLAIAAQRGRKSAEQLISQTAADGIITGTATINAVQQASAKAAVIVNDYSVLAGTQGYFHHKKLDRIIEVAHKEQLPVVMFAEGGGGRPGDTDVKTMITGLNVTSFSAWAALSGVVPRIAVANGNCFAGNAALFGCADIRIATRSASIGMAGPAMIEGGGLGRFSAEEIGPAAVHERNGVLDLLADDEAEATALAKQVLSYFQGPTSDWECAEQASLNTALPENRRLVYEVRDIIRTVFDRDSFLELKPNYGKALVTGFARLEGKPVAILSNDCTSLGGAIDGEAALKAARFINLCNSFGIPLVALGDTPGFMVGPDSEAAGAVHQMSELFIAGAKFAQPLVAVFLRKGYGLGAMAMAGGGFLRPNYMLAWPTGEFGAMGLEGAVRLGFRKELEAIADPDERKAKFEALVAMSYEQGKASEAAAFLEIDGVIEPAQTRAVLVSALA